MEKYREPRLSPPKSTVEWVTFYLGYFGEDFETQLRKFIFDYALARRKEELDQIDLSVTPDNEG